MLPHNGQRKRRILGVSPRHLWMVKTLIAFLIVGVCYELFTISRDLPLFKNADLVANESVQRPLYEDLVEQALHRHDDDPSHGFKQLARIIGHKPEVLPKVIQLMEDKIPKNSNASALFQNVLHGTMRFRNLYRLIESLDLLRVEHSLHSELQSVGKQVYPWLPSHIFTNSNPYKGRGIVYTVSRPHAHYAYLSIKNLRYLGSDLPVVILHKGDDELPPRFREQLETLQDVTCKDISDALEWKTINPSGWSIKPFALLLSPFEETIFMDSDTFWFQRPEILFHDPGYQATGKLFFFDRTLKCHIKSCPGQWVKTIVTHPSPRAQEMRMWQMRSGHDQESGVVVIDRKRALMGMLVTCQLNSFDVRAREAYQHVHGDKELFWIGNEIVNEPYSFYSGYGGSIGQADGSNTVCGILAHVDTYGRPVWTNGGLEVDKRFQHDRLINMTHVIGDPRGRDISWVEGSGGNDGFCLTNQKERAIPLSEFELNIPQWLRAQFLKLRHDESLHFFWVQLNE
jgi:hypothetical protein